MRAVVLTFPVFFLTLLMVSCGANSSHDASPRLLLIGWDGASFRMIDRLRDEGRLPNLSRLMDRGVHARLDSTIIPISAAAWTSAVTGKGPGYTGVYEFFEPVEGTYDVRLISSRSNRASPLWRILTSRGRRSIIFGVPVTYPPEPILGTMVSGMLSPFHADYAWPAEYTEELRTRGFEPDLETWTEVRAVGWADFLEQLAIKEAAVTELLQEDDWEFAMVVFKSLDVISHQTPGESFADDISDVYERLDQALGTLLDAVPANTNVMLVSDHGFHVYEQGMNLHAWLLEQGFTVRRDKFKHFAIPQDAPVARRQRKTIQRLRAEIDWSQSRAFAAKTEGNFGAIRLNLAGREPEGTVPLADVNQVVDELRAGLLALVDDSGNPLVTRVYLRAELYDGPYAAQLPDLFFETIDACQVFTDVNIGQVAGPYAASVPDHDRTGVLVAAGPSVVRRSERSTADILDVAPTVLHLLGLPVYSEMTGGVLFGARREVRYLREAEDPNALAAPRRGVGAFTREELEELEQRLGLLGYVE